MSSLNYDRMSVSDTSAQDDDGDVGSTNSPANSFQLPPRNPVLENFVNATDSQNYVDPATALSAAESRCVGLVASAESFAQQRHAKLQQLFKRIQMTNNEEVHDLSARVSVCESALQELASLLEHVQLHIQSASTTTHEFIRGCTVDRNKSEGRLLTSINSMLVQYEQQRRAWRRQAAQLLIQQDLAGIQTELDDIVYDDDDDDKDEDDKEKKEGGDDDAKHSNGNARMGFLALEQERNATGNADDDGDADQQQQTTGSSATTAASQLVQQQQQQDGARNKKRNPKRSTILKYMPLAVREKRRTILQRFASTLGQMLIDGDSVDRPFLLDATYARVIRYADVLTLQGETICRHVAEMFHSENTRRDYFVVHGERTIFKQNAEALCPPNLVPIGDEPIYTVFVQQLVEHRLDRELKCLQMMDSGLETNKAAMQKALDASMQKFTKTLSAVLSTLTKHGVMMLHPAAVAATGVASSVETDQQAQQSDSFAGSAASANEAADKAAAGPLTPTGARYRARTLTTSSFGGGGGGGGGSSIASAGGSLVASSSGNNGVTEANVAAIVSRLLSTSFGEQLPQPHSTDAAVQKAESGAMQRVFFRLLDEVAKTLSETHQTLSSGFHETIAAVQPSPINLIDNPTVLSLDSLKSELAHQALLLKIASANEGSERSRLVDELKQERQRNNALQHDLDEKSRQLITLEAGHASKDAEVHELESAVKTRAKSYVNMRREIRRINYQLTSDSFGRGWQESVLTMRESMVHQMQEENQSLLRSVKQYQKQKFDEQERVVALLERGFLATTESIEHDHKAKQREADARSKVEVQRVRDECELRVKNAHIDAQEEIKRSREMFESLYNDRVNDLNTAFDEKVRQVEQRQRDWEDRLWDKMKQIRADFREKEVNIEKQYAAKHEAVLRIYEEEANTLKRNVNEKEAQLESERLSVHLEIERQISEGVAKVKNSYEIVRSNLQDTMLNYLAEQRSLYDGQRSEELELFSDFAFGGMKRAKDTAFSIVETNRKTFQSQVEESQKAVQEATMSANDVSGRLLKHRDELHENRLVTIKANNEQLLRKTQLVRIEQDEKTWNQIHKEIVMKAAELDKKRAQTEELMTQRYIDIVKTLHTYIQNDVSSAHQTFERECQFRQEQLRNYLNHFHLVSLRVESELWREENDRNDIEREAMSLLNLLMSRSRTEAEYMMRNAIIQGHISTLNTDAEETTYTTIEDLRARYEGLLRRQHQLMGAMSHDYVSSMQHYVSTQNTTSEAISNVFAARIDEMHAALRSKWELHWASRDMIVERVLDGLVQQAAFSCKELLGGAATSTSSRSSPPRRSGRVVEIIDSPSSSSGDQTTAAATSTSTAANVSNSLVVRAPADAAASSSSSSANTSTTAAAAAAPLFYAEDVRVVEYFTSVKELLSKTFEQLEAKITAGNEEREHRQRQVAIDMRARFLDAAAALTRRAEQLEDKILDAKMENNSLQAQLHLKSESEIRAAILAEDLKNLVGQYRLLTQNVLIQGAFNSETQQSQQQQAAAISSSIGAGGVFRRQHLLRNQNTNIPSATFGPNISSSSQQQGQGQGGGSSQFQPTFVLDVGGKKATRDVVMENALLRERLLATEWKSDKFLKDALMSSTFSSSSS